jgi:DNA-binding transcriptional MerR regulator
MRIGELARQAGVSTRTLRHYEELGLLTPRRTANGYWDYADAEQPKAGAGSPAAPVARSSAR